MKEAWTLEVILVINLNGDNMENDHSSLTAVSAHPALKILVILAAILLV